MTAIEKLERIACTSRLPSKTAVRRAEVMCKADGSGKAKMLLRHIKLRHILSQPLK